MSAKKLRSRVSVNARGIREAPVGSVLPDSTRDDDAANSILTLDSLRALAAVVRAVRNRLSTPSDLESNTTPAASPGEPGSPGQPAGGPPRPARRPGPARPR
jgi:hypothetical protein